MLLSIRKDVLEWGYKIFLFYFEWAVRLFYSSKWQESLFKTQRGHTKAKARLSS